jgi:class 3 adenylate cyclase
MRTKIFVWVALLFGGTIFAIGSLRFYEVKSAIGEGTKEIARVITGEDLEKRKNILEYLKIASLRMENQIEAVFDKIQDLEWIQKRLDPENIEKYPNHWEQSAIAIMSNEWLDLIQTTVGNKLTSSIILRPPYLEQFFYIPVNELLSVVAHENPRGKMEAFIAVPYWTDAIAEVGGEVKKISLEPEMRQQNFLLFSVKDLLAIDTSALKVKKIHWETNPLDSSVVIKHDAYLALMGHLIDSIALLQKELQKDEDLISILKDPNSIENWVFARVEKFEPLCKEKDCDTWASRYDQNQLIWKLGEVFGSGIWNFNPYEKTAPLGICSLTKTDLTKPHRFYKSVGLLTHEIVGKEIIPFKSDCTFGDKPYCISNTFDVRGVDQRKGVYFTKTMSFRGKDETVGTLTLGVSMNDILQQLALVIPGSILFIKESGEKVFFHQNGDISDIPNWGQIDFSKLVYEDTGAIKNIGGKEFLFVHFVPVIEGAGQVFVIEIKRNVYELLGKLTEKAMELLHKLFIENVMLGACGILLALMALNQILKKGIAPLTKLAETTHLIAEGNLGDIQIPEAWKKREDEVGILCRAFEQMVFEMKEGLKVKAILNKVVSKEIVAKILKDGVNLGGEVREVTVLFADIRHFTKISESMPPEDVLEMLNSCLNVLSKVIDEHEGVIDKYIGDEIMAIFGAPVEADNSAEQAVRCAKIMMDVLGNWNEMRKERGLFPLSIGISIHTGKVIVGNVGAENHLSYTVLGHNVNLASRIAGHAGEMEILISKETLDSLKGVLPIEVLPLGPISFKGISNPIPLYRVML